MRMFLEKKHTHKQYKDTIKEMYHREKSNVRTIKCETSIFPFIRYTSRVCY